LSGTFSCAPGLSGKALLRRSENADQPIERRSARLALNQSEAAKSGFVDLEGFALDLGGRPRASARRGRRDQPPWRQGGAIFRSCIRNSPLAFLLALKHLAGEGFEPSIWPR